jgi:hypothetical protein
MSHTQYVEVFRTRQRHEAELALAELRAARISAWKQEHSLAGPVTECTPFPAVAQAASYSILVPRREVLRATAALAQSGADRTADDDVGPAPVPRFARYTALVVLTLLLLGVVHDFVETLRAAS